ncbi:hypothetical protein F5144DRAFT_85009 [Chaetomium tenue]|uniref:Uncharacterized protein n=1 Tax=Chaetomium tenue TaxID=1854479 RepID=A0ACB7PTE3_9PEZI|nr:hypothetical protein F5144DRAFT_85009 [Chaetomium globosum]
MMILLERDVVGCFWAHMITSAMFSTPYSQQASRRFLWVHKVLDSLAAHVQKLSFLLPPRACTRYSVSSRQPPPHLARSRTRRICRYRPSIVSAEAWFIWRHLSLRCFQCGGFGNSCFYILAALGTWRLHYAGEAALAAETSGKRNDTRSHDHLDEVQRPRAAANSSSACNLANADKSRIKLFFEHAMPSWPLASVPVDMPSVVVSIAKRGVNGWESSVGGERASSICRDEHWWATKLNGDSARRIRPCAGVDISEGGAPPSLGCCWPDGRTGRDFLKCRIR